LRAQAFALHYEYGMTTDERLDRLTTVVETLAGAVAAHDSVLEAHDKQIGALITVAERNQVAIAKMTEKSERLERQWQAYLNTLRRQ
jgi:hypothetical protein